MRGKLIFLSCMMLATTTAIAGATAAHAQVSLLWPASDRMNLLAGPLLEDPFAITEPLGKSTSKVQAITNGDSEYRPDIGQAGKDVIWVPTPPELVRAMLETARVTPADHVVDLGSGDGRIAIAAARDFGAKATGLEYNGDMVALARREARRAGVAGKVKFREADIFKTDFSDATVVTMYLLPSLNLKLRPALLDMKPGTRIVSHAFTLGDWLADETITTDSATGYYWVVPAKVAGRWAFDVSGKRFTGEIEQKFQHLSFPEGGAFQNGSLKGADIELERTGGGKLRGTVSGDTMQGQGWSAMRIRDGN
ncbi:MAG: class I SAM-dependent methyltransferase [Sphingomonadaceae bacterium]